MKPCSTSVNPTLQRQKCAMVECYDKMLATTNCVLWAVMETLCVVYKQLFQHLIGKCQMVTEKATFGVKRAFHPFRKKLDIIVGSV